MKKVDERFQQLVDCANEGDACAVQDLWLEYGFVYGRDEA